MKEPHFSRKGIILKRLRRHYEVSSEYLDMIKTGNAQRGEIPFPGNWRVYNLIVDHPKAATYFPPDILEEAKRLPAEWGSHIREFEKETYSECERVKELNFPWFENMSLGKNLEKTLPVTEFYKYGARACSLSLSDSQIDSIQFSALKKIAESPRTAEIYERKKSLEEKMIANLESEIN